MKTTTLSTCRPAIARVGYLGDSCPAIAFGYWQRDGSWQDAHRDGPGGGLEHAIRRMLERGERTVVISVHSFSGAVALGHEYTRDDLPENGGTIELPTDPEHEPNRAAIHEGADAARDDDDPDTLIQVLIYDHRHGIDIGLFSTERRVREGAAAIARRRWHHARELDPDLPEEPPTDDELVVELYLEATGFDESFGFDACHVDADIAIVAEEASR